MPDLPQDARSRRRRRVSAAAAAIAATVVSGLVLASCGGDSEPAAAPAIPATPSVAATATSEPATAPPPDATTTPERAVSSETASAVRRFPASDTTDLVRRDRITGSISPKSVVASPTGLVTAQNMMYTHTVTMYSPDGELEATLQDSVDLADFDVDGHPGTSKGAPVEAAFTHDGKYVYVSNYAMYGANWGPEGSDSCTPASAPDRSYLYKVDTATKKVVDVVKVGAVPKYVAVTPDDSKVLVTNWCSWDLSIIDTKTDTLVRTVKSLGRYPRGIAVSPDSKTAYIAIMGGGNIQKVDLASGTKSRLSSPGAGPRHLVISPDGKYLYVTNNSSGTVAKVDARTGKVLRSVSTGAQPRSMAISPDGKAVYVVNYESSTVSKLRTSDLRRIDRVEVDHHPIGITYEPTTGSVWVACYGGSIIVFDDTAKA